MKTTLKTTILWTVSMILISACVAIVTTIVLNRSLENYAQQLQQTGDYIRISQERPNPLPNSYEEALSYVKTQVGDIGYVTFDNVGSDTYADFVDRIGAVITSDGWMLVSSGSRNAFVSGNAVAWIDGVDYQIDDLVEEENYDLIHLVGAQNLTPFAFGDSSAMEAGQHLFGFGPIGAFYVTTLVDGQHVDSTNTVPASLGAPDYEQVAYWQVEQNWPNVLYVNSAGELVAISADLLQTTVVYPMQYALPWIQASIRGEDYVPARLGVSVEWLDALLVNTVDRTSGALVQRVYDSRSVFEVGDVITRVDGEMIDGHTPLAGILVNDSVGDTVHVTFVRDGQTQEADVELFGDDLVY